MANVHRAHSHQLTDLVFLPTATCHCSHFDSLKHWGVSHMELTHLKIQGNVQCSRAERALAPYSVKTVVIKKQEISAE